jgi:hypothetical protein
MMDYVTQHPLVVHRQFGKPIMTWLWMNNNLSYQGGTWVSYVSPIEIVITYIPYLLLLGGAFFLREPLRPDF